MRLYDLYFDRRLESKPYRQEEEYWRDWFAMLDMRLSVLLAYRLQKDDERNGEKAREFCLPETVVRGLWHPLTDAIAMLEAETIRWPEQEGGEAVRHEAVRHELCLAEAYLMSRIACTPKSVNRDGLLIRKLMDVFGLSKTERFLLFLSMAVHYDARYAVLFGCLEGEEKGLPSIRLGFALYELTDRIAPAERGRLLAQKGRLFDYLLTGEPQHSGPPGTVRFLLAARIYTFLLERRFLAPELEPMVTAYQQEELHPLHIRPELTDQVERLIKAYAGKNGGACYVVQLYGERGNGRHFAVRHAARRNGFNVLFVNVARLMDGKTAELDLLVRVLKRECILTHSILCFEAEGYQEETVDADTEGLQRVSFPLVLDYLLNVIAREMPFFIWLTMEKAGYLTRYPLHFMALESPLLTVGERIVLWQTFSGDYTFSDDIDLLLSANQYILTAGGIRAVLHRAAMMCAGAGRSVIEPDMLQAAVKQQSANQLGQYATLINSVFTWDDLVIDEEQKRQMQMICDQVRYRNVVGEEWGFHKKTPYGRGICALFYGSPGTGKTMAVQVMANALGMDLYRIDLSQMVSKYIGETQKNISTLFRKARNINALLFFDEADAMFARRSEVKDANDRYANSETAHLLQKLEDYSGITILATNYVNNIDDAFKRRIKFMVNFVFPAEDMRYRLWTTMIPPAAAYAEELDFEFFARNFELSGSNIKEILTNAAYLAAAQHRGLANGDIVTAVKLNFAKYGKILTDEDFGYLAQGNETGKER